MYVLIVIETDRIHTNASGTKSTDKTYKASQTKEIVESATLLLPMPVPLSVISNFRPPPTSKPPSHKDHPTQHLLPLSLSFSLYLTSQVCCCLIRGCHSNPLEAGLGTDEALVWRGGGT